MASLELWAQMQRVELLRYRAELLERAAIDQTPAVRKHLLGLAAQTRRLAAKVYASGLPRTQGAERSRPAQETVPQGADATSRPSRQPPTGAGDRSDGAGGVGRTS